MAGVLVFVISLGFFVTPAILGGPKESMISNLIAREVSPFLNLPGAASMSLLLLVVTLAILALVYRFLDLGRFLRDNQ